jgi:hypothetical protein
MSFSSLQREASCTLSSAIAGGSRRLPVMPGGQRAWHRDLTRSLVTGALVSLSERAGRAASRAWPAWDKERRRPTGDRTAGSQVGANDGRHQAIPSHC